MKRELRVDEERRDERGQASFQKKDLISLALQRPYRCVEARGTLSRELG